MPIIRAYRQNQNVLYAEPNYIYHALTTPNDPKFTQLWGLQNTGQNLGTVGADIHATQAWVLTTGRYAAVLDLGEVDFVSFFNLPNKAPVVINTLTTG